MTARASSPFAVRGVVEGFYGRPWTHPQRLDLVEFIAARGMNTFVYAPKGDPLIRRDWRLAYAGMARTRIAELVRRCLDHGVDLVYCLSPGLSIEYANPDDVALLSAKFQGLEDLGVRAFGLLLDDIPLRLQHERDQRAFGDLVEAHSTLIGTVFDRVRPAGRFFVCPTVYRGYGDEEYIARLGHAIDPRIDLFWTGRAICSATLDLIDAATFARATGRPATYWDNYPVNDVAMGHELHVGPYRGRDPHLWRFSTGVIANGMERFESSKIAFATIADYLRSPEDYDPEASWRTAIRDVAGAADAEAYTTFADNVRSSCLSDEDAPVVGPALEQFAFAVEHEDRLAAARDLGTLARQLLDAADHLLDGEVANRVLVDEARPWLSAFRAGAEAMLELARLAAEDRLHVDGPGALQTYLDRLRDARVRVFGDALHMALAEHIAAAIIDPSVTVQSPVGGGDRS